MTDAKPVAWMKHGPQPDGKTYTLMFVPTEGYSALYSAEAYEAVKRERNVFAVKYRSIVALMNKTRWQVQEIFDHIEDEGDRAYFGSTNHSDWLSDMLKNMDRWSFDAMLPSGDINKMEADPYATIREQRARAEAAERERDEAQAEAKRLRAMLFGITERPPKATVVDEFVASIFPTKEDGE